MKHIVILRFSALGDVLMTLPVVDAVARRYPDVRFTFVSRAWAQPLVAMLPDNVGFVAADLRGAHKGLSGLNRLCRRLMALRPTAIADLHDVLRTQWLRIRFRLAGVHTAAIDKGRTDRRRFITSAVKSPQRPVFERYADVFRCLGFDVDIDFRSFFAKEGADLSTALPTFNAAQRPECYWIGVAPFAAHEGKVYPLDLMAQVVGQLAARGDMRIYLFGAGAQEQKAMDEWAQRFPHVESMVGRLHGLAEELALISHCDVMVSMDSANMHLASLAGVRVVSIWGATHPLGGFLGYGQSTDDVVQRTDLDCRPCSTYGQKPCRYGDFRCMRGIKPEEVVAQVVKCATAKQSTTTNLTN